MFGCGEEQGVLSPMLSERGRLDAFGMPKKRVTKRLVDAMNSKCSNDGSANAVGVAESFYLDTANHNLSEGKGDAERFVAKVTELLKEAGSES